MGDLSTNLSRYEMACECKCGFDTVDAMLVKVLQSAVNYFQLQTHEKVRLEITGGNRCEKHNATIKGAVENSQHTNAKAADFKLFFNRTDKQIKPSVVARYLNSKYKHRFGIGIYRNRVHLDVRDSRARWDKS